MAEEEKRPILSLVQINENTIPPTVINETDLQLVNPDIPHDDLNSPMVTIPIHYSQAPRNRTRLGREMQLLNGFCMSGWTEFEQACRDKNMEQAKTLLDSPPPLLRLSNLLEDVCFMDVENVEIVKLLIPKCKPIPPYIVNKAINRGHIHIVQTLLESDSDLSYTDALTSAVAYEQTSIINMLLDMRKNLNIIEPLYSACSLGRLELVKTLITYKPTVFYGTSRLTLGCNRRNTSKNIFTEMAERYNAPLQTCLEQACGTHNIQLIQYLFTLGAQPSDKGLVQALTNNRTNGIEFMVRHGLKLPAVLYHACVTSNWRLARLFVHDPCNLSFILHANQNPDFARRWMRDNSYITECAMYRMSIGYVSDAGEEQVQNPESWTKAQMEDILYVFEILGKRMIQKHMEPLITVGDTAFTVELYARGIAPCYFGPRHQQCILDWKKSMLSIWHTHLDPFLIKDLRNMIFQFA